MVFPAEKGAVVEGVGTGLPSFIAGLDTFTDFPKGLAPGNIRLCHES